MTNSSFQSPSPLNLEQQRKRAKELVRAFRAGDPATVERMREHLPRAQGVDTRQLLTGRLSLARVPIRDRPGGGLLELAPPQTDARDFRPIELDRTVDESRPGGS